MCRIDFYWLTLTNNIAEWIPRVVSGDSLSWIHGLYAFMKRKLINNQVLITTVNNKVPKVGYKDNLIHQKSRGKYFFFLRRRWITLYALVQTLILPILIFFTIKRHIDFKIVLHCIWIRKEKNFRTWIRTLFNQCSKIPLFLSEKWNSRKKSSIFSLKCLPSFGSVINFLNFLE